MVEVGGQREKVAFFCLILPHSGVWFVKAYPRETTEDFLGRVNAFGSLAGVPRSILYDNTTLAVARILGDGTRWHWHDLRTPLYRVVRAPAVYRPITEVRVRLSPGAGDERLPKRNQDSTPFKLKEALH